MSEQPIKLDRNSNSDEIDLLDLFSRMGKSIIRMFAWLGHALVSVIVFLVRKSPYWIAGGFIGSVIAVILSATAEPYYESTMVLRSNAVGTQELISSVTRLHQYAYEGNYSSLAAELRVDVEKITNLGDVEAFWMIDSNGDGLVDFVDYKNDYLSDTNYVKLEDRFTIRVKIKKTAELKIISNGLVDYFEANPYFSDRNQLRLQQLEVLIERTNMEIGELDRLQKKKYFEEPDMMRLKEGQLLFMSEQKTELFHNEIFKLIQQKQGYERTLAVNSGIVTLLEELSVPVKQQNGLRYYGLKWGPAMLILGLLIAVLTTFREPLRRIYREY